MTKKTRNSLKKRLIKIESPCQSKKGSAVPCKRIRYYLGDKYPGVYFTFQEARCMFYFMHGFTNIEMSLIMKVSHRTIDFYSVMILTRVSCDSKWELIEKIKKTDFNNYMDELEKLEINFLS